MRVATYADAIVVAEHRRTARVQGLWLVAGRSRMIIVDRLIGQTPESFLGTFLPECGYTRRVLRDLRKPQLGRFRNDHEVGRQRHLQPAADGMSVHSRDDGLRTELLARAPPPSSSTVQVEPAG